MNNATFIRRKDGNTIGNTTVDERTGLTTIRERPGNLGYGTAKRARLVVKR